MSVKINKSDMAYDRLEQMITFQELKPGSMMSEADLMNMTGLGRTPIREALQRLAWERMVEIHPRRGAIVPLISVDVQIKLLEVRRAVEEQAVRLASHRASAEQKQAMLQLANELESTTEDNDGVRTYGNLLKRIHELLVLAAQNEYLELAIAPLQGLSRRFWFANLGQNRNVELRTAAGLHANILRAICHSNENAAATASHALNDYLTEFTYRTLRRS